MTRRAFLFVLSFALGELPVDAPRRRRWIDTCPSVVQTSNLEALVACGARVLLVNIAADPTWGPYGQRLSIRETRDIVRRLRGRAVRTITYIEGAGDCMVYAAAFNRSANGTFEGFPDDPDTARPVRTHWSWTAEGLPAGDEVRWVGIQASVLSEDFVTPRYALDRIGVPQPRYPDGRLAVGRGSRWPAPLDAELWDACASKDLNGRIRPIFAPAVGVVPGVDIPPSLTRGLYRAVAGQSDIEGVQAKSGATVWCGVISVHKDLSAPFWRDYARASAREIARAGVDGVWCDNWSPWDNFGYPPIKHAFGEWSLHRVHAFIMRLTPKHTVRAGQQRPMRPRDVRAALMSRARTYGITDPTNLEDRGWSSPVWVKDPLWRLFKAGRQISAREDLERLYRALHRGAREGGARDFAVCGNDIPMYALGWARDRWTDMVHTETTPGWHMGSGTRGIMLPPDGKMAVVYRAALAHQSGRYCAAWYYLDNAHARFQGKEGLARVLLAEALANGAFLLCDPQQERVAGSVETHAWLNRFVRNNEEHFLGRSLLADTAVVFSPDCQLYELAPGGFPDMDRQPHIFGHWGWGTALLDAHMPYRALPDWRLTRDGLRGVRTLVLPNVICLADAAMSAIVRWARMGGRLVVNGPCGINHGTEGGFMERDKDLLAALGLSAGAGWVKATVGRGTVVHTSEPAGMDYYLRTSEREGRLVQMRDAVGPSTSLPIVGAPKTVEVAPWSVDGRRRITVDLANTAIDHQNDRVVRTGALTFDVSLPWEGSVRASAISPDGRVAVQCSRSGSSATVRVGGLEHYVSVVLEPR